MEEVTLARAKAHVSELVERAARGEPIRITRRGKAVARLTGVERRQRPVDLKALQAMTQSMPMQPAPARSWLRSVRDELALLMLYIDRSVLVSALTNEADTARNAGRVGVDDKRLEL